MESIGALEARTKELHANDDLWSRVKIFYYDLMSFSSKESSRQRMNLYILCRLLHEEVSIFFSKEEMHYLLDFPTSSEQSRRDVLTVAFNGFLRQRQGISKCAKIL